MDQESWGCPQGLMWLRWDLSRAACGSRISAGPGSPRRGSARWAVGAGAGRSGTHEH